MKRRALLCSLPLAAAAGSVQAADDKDNAPRVSPQDIAAGKVVITGRLGLALGAIVKVTGTFVDGTATRAKALEGRVLLRVETVDGRVLAEPVESLYVDESGSYGEKHLRKQLPSSPKTVFVYETGGFSGIPADLFKYKLPSAGRSFGFATHLVIVADKPLESGPR